MPNPKKSPVTEAGRVLVKTTQVAVDRGRGAELHAGTQVVASFATHTATETGYPWLDSDAISNLNVQKFESIADKFPLIQTEENNVNQPASQKMGTFFLSLWYRKFYFYTPISQYIPFKGGLRFPRIFALD